MSGGERSIDLVDLVPAQVFGIMVLVQYGIVELIAYDGRIDLEQVYTVGGIDVSLAFIFSTAALATIVATNELTADDVVFWEESDDDDVLDEVYGFTIAATFGLMILVEFSTYVNDLVTGSDVLATVAFALSVVAVWAIVWVR